MKNLLIALSLLLSMSAQASGAKHGVPSPTATPHIVLPTDSPASTSTPINTPSPAQSHNWWKTPNGADLRACDGPIESQQTPWCTAFSFAGILENMICDHSRLSIHHVWSFYEEYSGDEAAAKAPGHNITTWDEWTEDSNKPKQDYLNFAKHQITAMKYIDADDDIEYAFKVLDSGLPVYIAMAVPADMASCYSIIRPTTKITSGGHMLEIAGYGKDQKVGGGAYFIIKQSWGIDCGDNGYQYFPVSVCANSEMYCYLYEPISAK